MGVRAGWRGRDVAIGEKSPGRDRARLRGPPAAAAPPARPPARPYGVIMPAGSGHGREDAPSMSDTFLGRTPRFDASNYVAPTAAVVGDVTLGEGASVWFGASLRGDVHWIEV